VGSVLVVSGLAGAGLYYALRQPRLPPKNSKAGRELRL
jgi:hypothetical protein